MTISHLCENVAEQVEWINFAFDLHWFNGKCTIFLRVSVFFVFVLFVTSHFAQLVSRFINPYIRFSFAFTIDNNSLSFASITKSLSMYFIYTRFHFLWNRDRTRKKLERKVSTEQAEQKKRFVVRSSFGADLITVSVARLVCGCIPSQCSKY